MDNESTGSSAPQADGGSGFISQTQIEGAKASNDAELDSPYLGEDQISSEQETQEEPDWFQKRINKLTAEKKAGNEVIEELQAQVKKLEEQLGGQQKTKEDSEPTEAQLRSELKRAAEEGDWDYLAQITEYMAKKIARNEKESFVSQSEEQMANQQRTAQEWATLVDEYGSAGLNDKNSQLYKLAEAHYKNNVELGQYGAVAKAYRELSEKGLIRSDHIKNTEQQLQKEKRKAQLGTGIGPGASDSVSTKPKTHSESQSDFVKERIANALKMRGLS